MSAMENRKVRKLQHGLYLILWDDGGPYSLASVGSDAKGNRWFAPTNWIEVPSFDWKQVKSARLLFGYPDMLDIKIEAR
jgi:hypothetical protein